MATHSAETILMLVTLVSSEIELLHDLMTFPSLHLSWEIDLEDLFMEDCVFIYRGIRQVSEYWQNIWRCCKSEFTVNQGAINWGFTALCILRSH